MEMKEKICNSKDNLTRILSYFPRTDTLASLLGALNIGLLLIIATNSPPLPKIGTGVAFIGLLYIILSGISLGYLYKSLFPNLEGNGNSLIFFDEISRKTIIEYHEKFNEQTDEEYLSDLSTQVWFNSVILKRKFENLQKSATFFAISLIFGLILLVILISNNTQTLLQK